MGIAHHSLHNAINRPLSNIHEETSYKRKKRLCYQLFKQALNLSFTGETAHRVRLSILPCFQVSNLALITGHCFLNVEFQDVAVVDVVITANGLTIVPVDTPDAGELEICGEVSM